MNVIHYFLKERDRKCFFMIEGQALAQTRQI
jgi:hypothetical protein